MTEDRELIAMMDRLEADDLGSDSGEVSEIRECLHYLKQTTTAVPDEVDKRMLERMDGMPVAGSSRMSGRVLISVITAVAAAGILIVLLLPFGGSSLKSGYGSLGSNTDKLSFVFALYDRELDADQVSTLKELLLKEQHPNLKVAMLDLLEPYSEEHYNASELFANLTASEVPTVQMAVLNLLQNSNHRSIRTQLENYYSTHTLDKMVSERLQAIISNHQSKNESL